MSEQTPQPQDENQIVAERREKLAKLRAEGVAFPNDFLRENTAEKLDELYGEKSREELEAQPAGVCVAGRILLKGAMGKAPPPPLPRADGPPALPLPHHHRALARGLRRPLAPDAVDPRLHERPRLPRSR